MRLIYVSLVLILVCCFEVYSSNVPEQFRGDIDRFAIRINSDLIAFPFTESRIAVGDLGGSRTINLAYIMSPPLGTIGFKCVFHSPTRGIISEPFDHQTLFSSKFESAEYIHCYDIIDKNLSLVLLELADGTPLLGLPMSSAWWREWYTVNAHPVEIRRAALIVAAEGVERCAVKTADGSIGHTGELGRFIDVSGSLAGVSCRKKPWLW